jgi:hypothetical protein
MMQRILHLDIAPLLPRRHPSLTSQLVHFVISLQRSLFGATTRLKHDLLLIL